jgi:anti-sigma factor RsiW
MNPDKLFDYLDGRLPAPERAALEKQLISDRQLQRELAVARQIQTACIAILASSAAEQTDVGARRKLAPALARYPSFSWA